jgi:hypothetical protein
LSLCPNSMFFKTMYSMIQFGGKHLKRGKNVDVSHLLGMGRGLQVILMGLQVCCPLHFPNYPPQTYIPFIIRKQIY